MISTTTQKEQNLYNVKEYALSELNNRNHLTHDIDDIISKHNTDQLYQSYFDHSNEIIEHWENTKNRNENNTVTGYNGAVAIRDVVIDIDLQHGETDLEISRDRATKVIDRLQKKYGVKLVYIYPNFSGSKGFHIRLPSELFDEFEPSEDLPKIIKEICKEIAGDVKIDETVFKTTGLMRVPNTLNKKTGFYAIPLTAVDVTNLNIASIQAKAKTPISPHNYPNHFPPVPELVELKNSIIKQLQEEDHSNTKSSKRLTVQEQARISITTFNLDDEVKLANGKKEVIKNIHSKTPIYCPFCDHATRSHATANAFIDINDKGHRYVHCSSETKTYWQQRFNEKGIFTRNTNEYYKLTRVGKEFIETQLTSFIIEPKELLKLDDSDVLKCDIKTVDGAVYTDKLITNNDWTSKASLLRAIGNQDCNFLGNDTDVQPISQFINKRIPVMKKGTKTIGLIEDKWVLTDRNINEHGEMEIPEIVPSEKGAGAFHNTLDYPIIPDQEMKDLIKGFYENILNINKHETIVPFVMWGLVAPLKTRLLEFLDGFSHLFAHGNMGGGKTSTALMMMRLWGFKSQGVNSCTLNAFPMLKLMNATNGTPIVFDEFKKQDMTDFHLDQMHRMLRSSYTNEVVTKGNKDQTITSYPITAPMVVMGEWRIAQPAIRERILVSSFTDAVKDDPNMQQAFNRLRLLPLESFMNWFIPFALKQDAKKIYEEASNKVLEYLGHLKIPPRVLQNLGILYVGYLLFNAFAKENGIDPPVIDMKAILEHQIEEITGNKTGKVQSSVDQLVEAFSAMAADKGISENYDYRIIDDEEPNKRMLAIPFKDLMPRFKEWIRRTNYEIEILDKNSYWKMFDDTDYIVEKSKKVKFRNSSNRCIYIDIVKAQKIGIDIEGMVGLSMSHEEKILLEENSYV